LTYSYAGTHTQSYEATVREGLAHAAWLKDTSRGSKKVTVDEMVGFYNEARVGLILSEREGAVFASMEYLLCGLPVVSTPSTGGRDVFWDDRFVIVCEPNPEAVAEAVQELKLRNIDPQLIRNATLEQVEKHRDVLREFLAPAVKTFECPWSAGSHGPFTFTDLRKLGRSLRQPNFL
jgi:glycosyltransferase involved in cell wall biosynthesis